MSKFFRKLPHYVEVYNALDTNHMTDNVRLFSISHWPYECFGKRFTSRSNTDAFSTTDSGHNKLTATE